MDTQDKLSFTQLAQLTMQMMAKPATPAELWDFVVQRNLQYRLNTYDEISGKFSGKTPKISFMRNIYTQDNIFAEVPNTKPKQYVLKNANHNGMMDNDFKTQDPIPKCPNATKNMAKKPKFHERDLHPLLCCFLKENEYFQAYSKTIFHEESQKGTKGEDKWLYPDMVAVNFEYANYQKNNLLDFIKKFDILPIKIFSFEIKKELNFSNYKESFFQAVSNSSWANEGYLVACHIKKDNQFVEALQKLSQSFGIGIIELDLLDIHQSKILSPARVKEKMDYSVVDELARKNPNFAQFLKTVTDFDFSNSNRFVHEFDEILSCDELGDFLTQMI